MNDYNDDTKAILYYSKRCPHCADVLNKIRLAENTISDFSNKFIYILVDGNNKLPSYIREVPTLVAPTHNQPITGDGVFMWIDTKVRKYSQQRMSQPPAMTPQQSHHSNDMRTDNSELGPLSYNPMEMSGFGDSFSFLDDSGDVQEHCFTFIDEHGKKQVKCVPASSGPSQQNMHHAQQSRAQLPQWLQSESVGRQSQTHNVMPTYNPDMTSMSQQNNIRLQQQARMNGSSNRHIPNFQDPQRQPMNDNSKISDMDYERFMNSRNNDPGISSAPQRI